MKYEVTTYNTKKMFADALKHAMSQKPFSKITVSEIVAACGVNRKTFYYHFEDIYALLLWIFKEEAIDVVKKFDLPTQPREALFFVMDYVEENSYLINCAYDSLGRDQLRSFLYDDFSSITKELLERVEALSGNKLESSYKEYLTKFYAEGLAGMLIDWIKHRSDRDREQTADYIIRTVRGGLSGIFGCKLGEKDVEKG